MIVPFLDGFMSFSKVPITWIIILLNTFLFSQNYNLSQECQEEFQAWYQDEDFLYTQGQLYKQFKQGRDLAQVSDMPTLGRLAFRDEEFMRSAKSVVAVGDSVAIAKWRDQVQDFLILRSYYPPLMLGMSDVQKDFFSTISYQFYHEGFAHLFGNILLILIVGGFLERRSSGLWVFGVYLVGGSLAALAFTLSGHLTGAPLVGASGSLCALLGFLFVTEMKTQTRLFYMILPLRRYVGFVFVPTAYWVLWLCMLEDLSGWLAQPAAVASGVAHVVHLMGFLMGIGLGGIYLIIQSSSLTSNSMTSAHENI